MRLGELLGQAEKTLARACVDSPRLSAQIIAAGVLATDRLHCLLETERELSAAQASEMAGLIERRSRGEPVAYLIGKREFYGRDMAVTHDTLIPRPETELLVDLALERTVPGAALLFADLGTGSGCIGVTLALERPGWKGFLLDISPGACKTAKRNVEAYDLGKRLAVLQADMRTEPLADGAFELVVSNPPYIGIQERAGIMDEVWEHEPRSALISGEEGLSHLRSAVRAAARMLKRGGRLIVEHGAGQGEAVRSFAAGTGCYASIETVRDLAGRDRCMTCLRLPRGGSAS